MSALPAPRTAQTRAMAVGDLPAVLSIEQRAYTHPWSHGNFIDSMAAGYDLTVLWRPPSSLDGGASRWPAAPDRRAGEELLGYFVAMAGVDEMHLLNLTVAPTVQGQGHARALLGVLCQRALAQQRPRLWLEVRPSNVRARALYERYGFALVGRRKAYYPLDGIQREDALVMNLNLAPESADGLE